MLCDTGIKAQGRLSIVMWTTVSRTWLCSEVLIDARVIHCYEVFVVTPRPFK